MIESSGDLVARLRANHRLKKWADTYEVDPLCLEAASHIEALQAKVEGLEKERDEARAGERSLSEHARKVAAEANEAFEAAESLDEFWAACGCPGNRGALTPAEQVAAIILEVDEAELRASTYRALLVKVGEGLEPFAKAAEGFEDYPEEMSRDGSYYDAPLKFGHFRRASALYQEIRAELEQEDSSSCDTRSPVSAPTSAVGEGEPR